MGGGTWTSTSATAFTTTKYAAYNVASLDALSNLDTRQVYDSVRLDPALDPKGVIRECLDSEEHPQTFPIILALDVTGSMGTAATMCAAKLNDIMENLYGKVRDVEFMMMGIGDLAYDCAPIQATQFESDVRILDQTTKIYFEGGGGGNSYESYTAAWYFGLHNTKLDCWKRGKKGLIITLGDEPLNPYLPGRWLGDKLGCACQDVDTEALYKEALKKFDIYHIVITDPEGSFAYHEGGIRSTWKKLLGQRCIFAKSKDLDKVIGQIVDETIHGNEPFVAETENTSEGIRW